MTGAFLVWAQGARAQAPAGPVTAAPTQSSPAARPQAPLPPPRQSILGAWKLNKDESDDMHNRSQDSRGSKGGGYGGRRGGGGWPGGGGGGRRGGYGGRRKGEQRPQKKELVG